MVTASLVASVSSRKLNQLLASNVSVPLRMEVLITNLLSSIERGEFSEEEQYPLFAHPSRSLSQQKKKSSLSRASPVEDEEDNELEEQDWMEAEHESLGSQDDEEQGQEEAEDDCLHGYSPKRKNGFTHGSDVSSVSIHVLEEPKPQPTCSVVCSRTSPTSLVLRIKMNPKELSSPIPPLEEDFSTFELPDPEPIESSILEFASSPPKRKRDLIELEEPADLPTKEDFSLLEFSLDEPESPKCPPSPKKKVKLSTGREEQEASRRS